MLEIHRAVEVLTGDANLPLLPAYVRRGHDDMLDTEVAEAAAGRSRLVCVVGESSTGKTRACWEAVRRLPAGWELWQPVAPGRAQALQNGLASVGPRTVVWLNEAQLFFQAPSSGLGEELAAGVRELLNDPQRGPVLVVATMWPGYWHELTAVPKDGEGADACSEARALLAGRDVQVARRLRPSELEEARRVAQSDPRLALAVENAIEGQVIQYLAGAPALLSRYESAPAGARSLMNAAMDAQRLGHGAILPYGLLAEGAEGYLTDEEWDALADDWLETAMAYTAAPVAGARGALVRRRPRARRMPGEAASGDLSCYRLADYLDQHGRTTRRETPVPEALWRALLAHGDESGYLALGASAERRGLLRIAAQFYAHAKDGGKELAKLLEDCGRPEEAHLWWIRSTTETGDSFALEGVLRTAPCETPEQVERTLTWWWEEVPKHSSQERTLSSLIQRLGPADDPKALQWWHRVAEHGDSESEWVVVGHLRETGGPDAVLAWYLERVGSTHWYLRKAADLLVELGRTEEAIALLASSDPDDSNSLRLAELLLERGKHQEAVEWLVRIAQSSSAWHRDEAVQALLRAGEGELALDLRKRTLNWHDPFVDQTAVLFEEAGRHAEALAFWRRASTIGNPRADVCLGYARSLVRNNELAEALTWYQRSVERGKYPATTEPWETELLRSQGASQTDVEEWHYTYLNTDYFLGKRLRRWSAPMEEKLAWLFELVKRGHPSAMSYAIRRLCDAGRESEALEWALERADGGDDRAPQEVASLYAAAGELDLALQWWERSAQQTSYGHAGYREGASALREAGRTEEALTWSHRAVEAGDVDGVLLPLDLYESLGRNDEALAYLWDLTERGSCPRTDVAADFLQRAGRERDAERLRRYGWEPDGSIAAAWTAPMPPDCCDHETAFGG
ncbi:MULTISPECIES: tetratricopeptide repeat protein [unclassified Streptomyces]|uniref:tetratricopeptide repeat protein n=1 Tax=unclassified Streptomyces TaxID=2593676 RepID=UPI002E299E86|nr:MULTISPECIES: hypothetical protein [unclassified Streptomyces]